MTCGLSHAERRAKLIAAHGPARPLTDVAVKASLLRDLHLRGTVHPRDVVAYAYRDAPAEQAWAASTAAHYGVPSLGTVTLDGAVAGVYDLRPALAAGGCPPTDPARPDPWTPQPGGGA